MRWGRGKLGKLSPSLIVRLGTAEKGLKGMEDLECQKRKDSRDWFNFSDRNDSES